MAAYPIRPGIFFIILSFFSLLNADVLLAAPRVLVSIKPIHSLVSFLMQDVARPQLLIQRNQSIHRYRMRPSQRRLLASADLIVYTANNVESFMSHLDDRLEQKKIINLSTLDSIHLLDARTTDGHKHGAGQDGHIWLAIDNAQTIARYLAQQLMHMDPSHKSYYRKNLQQLEQRLSQLKDKLDAQLKPIQNKPYVLFHDAFQYFENEFHLSRGHFVTSSAEHKMSIRQISTLKQQIIKENIRCIYYEPPHIPKLINTLTEGQQVRLLPLDPLGIEYKPGPELYFKHMQHIADQFLACLDK